MSAQTVAIAQGGTSVEREISVAGAQRVRRALEAAGNRVVQVEVDHLAVESLRDLGPDYVYVIAHGGEGEGGGLQSVLEVLCIPFTGSNSLASVLCMNKALAQGLLWQAGLPTPRFHAFSRRLFNVLGAVALETIEHDFPRPLVVKPAHGGSSFGIRVVTESDQLRNAIMGAMAYDDEVLIEQFIPGRELAVTLLGSAEDPTVRPVVEVLRGEGLYDYERHYSYDELSLARAALEPEVEASLVAAARGAYAVLGCRDIARVDLILDRDEQPQILELNTIPGLTETGPTPFAADLAGMSFADLVARVAERVARAGADA